MSIRAGIGLAVSAFIVFRSAPARAAPQIEDPGECVRILERAIKTGRAESIQPCLYAQTEWVDSLGFQHGASVRAAIQRWLDRFHPLVPSEGLQAVFIDSTTFLFGAYSSSQGNPISFEFVIDGPPPWDAVRVYTSESVWPNVNGVVRVSSHTTSLDDVDALVTAFNHDFSSGNVDAWMRHWDPDAVFYSAVGILDGKSVRSFFDHQSRRYAEPHLHVDHRYDGPWTGAALVEGYITGRCRERGTVFEIPVVMYFRLDPESGRIKSLAEGLLDIHDGCGAFWKPD